MFHVEHYGGTEAHAYGSWPYVSRVADTDAA